MSRWIVALVAVLVLIGCAGGPDGTPSMTPEFSEPVIERAAVEPEIDAWFRSTTPAATNQLVPGDLVEIIVAEPLDRLSTLREIPQSGEIPLQDAKSVNALHRTPRDLEKLIQEAYAASYPELYVTVLVKTAKPRHIFVGGAVTKPERYPLDGNDRMDVLKAITLANGATPDADLSSVTIRRMHPDRGVVVTSGPLDIKAVMEVGEQQDNLVVLPGDQIVVPEARYRVSVLGQVEKPGAISWYRGITLSLAITECGGFRRFAKQSAIRLARKDGSNYRIDFEQVLSGQVPDVKLLPNDVVYIDEKWL